MSAMRRKNNTGKILGHLKRDGACTLAEITEATALSKQIASVTLSVLKNQGQVRLEDHHWSLPAPGTDQPVVTQPKPGPLPHRQAADLIRSRLDTLIDDLPGAAHDPLRVAHDPRIVNLHLARHHLRAALDQWGWEDGGK